MKLLLIRHGDPDYEKDSLTPRGWEEARLLAEDLRTTPINAAYVSPLGRAQDTAKVVLEGRGIEAATQDWLQEFRVFDLPVYRDEHHTMPWDHLPRDWTPIKESYSADTWTESPIIHSPTLKPHHEEVTAAFDALLAQHGYRREGNLYRVEKPNTDTLAFFGHLGCSFVLAAHLTNISPTLLWHGFYMAPSSRILFVSEEVEKGYADFRCRIFGDVSHLVKAGVSPSSSGSFNEAYTD
ncbi:MAG: histidine phosphatase family protein [Oscillospiraceae bacterium]|nr:histidine phosphatase family protein [Oscillospiraceae bacterium]